MSIHTTKNGKPSLGSKIKPVDYVFRVERGLTPYDAVAVAAFLAALASVLVGTFRAFFGGPYPAFYILAVLFAVGTFVPFYAKFAAIPEFSEKKFGKRKGAMP